MVPSFPWHYWEDKGEIKIIPYFYSPFEMGKNYSPLDYNSQPQRVIFSLRLSLAHLKSVCGQESRLAWITSFAFLLMKFIKIRAMEIKALT
jgi:hypothetical protein